MNRTPPPTHLTTATAEMASVRQIDFIRDLIAQKDLGDHAEWAAQALKRAEAGEMPKVYASRLIGRLLTLDAKVHDANAPKRDIAAETSPFKHTMLWEFSAGRYAIEEPTDDLNTIRFYHVTIGKKDTRWAGYYFVNRMASDEEYPVKNKKERDRILKAIADNPLEAAQRYGNHFGHCAICSKGLTRRLSREMGIGPKCAENIGMPVEAIAAIKQGIIEAGHDPEEILS